MSCIQVRSTSKFSLVENVLLFSSTKHKSITFPFYYKMEEDLKKSCVIVRIVYKNSLWLNFRPKFSMNLGRKLSVFNIPTMLAKTQIIHNFL